MCLHKPRVMTCWDCTEDDLANLLLAAKYHYYNGRPFMTDTSYDWLEDKIKKLNPKHPCLEVVGSDMDQPPAGLDYSWVRACKLPDGETDEWKGRV